METLQGYLGYNTLFLFLSKSEKLLAKRIWMAVDVDQSTGMRSGVT